MPKMIFVHTVRNVDHWASKHSERVEVFAPFASDLTDYLSADGSKTVSVSANVHDVEGLRAALQSPETLAIRNEHGVEEPITVLVENS